MIQVYDKYGKIKSSGLPGTGTVTSFSAGNLSPLFNSIVTSPTSTPNISFSTISQAQNLFYASPNGVSGVPTFRALVAADIPTLTNYVPTSRTLTINGVTFDLSANRTWTISGATWGTITGTLSSQTDLQNALDLKANLASPTFTGTVSGITASMVGLGNVDNTSDANKPVSTATQTALDLKADKSSTSTIIIRNITPSTPLTGTTSETQITSFNFTIPANTFSANDILKVETIAWEKSGVANASTCRIKLSNTNNYAGASNVLVLAASANNINMRGTRTYKIAGGNLKGLMSNSANGIFNDNTLTNIAVSTLALDVTQPIYGFVSLNNTSSADSTIVNELIISKW
jgi:hypothetical protein